jgi:large repetitive protein
VPRHVGVLPGTRGSGVVVRTTSSGGGAVRAMVRVLTVVLAVVAAGVGAGVAGAPVAGAAAAGPEFGLTISAPASLSVGRTDAYRVIVANGGDADSSAAVLLALPADVSFVRSSGPASCAGNRVVACTFVAVASGGSAEVEVEVVPAPPAAGTEVAVTGSVDPTGGLDPADPTTCTGTDRPATGCAVSASRPVGNGIELEPTLSGPADPTVGSRGEYVLDIANTGTATAASATVLLDVPAGFTTGHVSGATCGTTRPLRCTTDREIAPGGVGVLRIDVVPTAAASGRTVRGVATVDVTGGSHPADPAGCVGDPLPAGCAATDAVPVRPGVDLALTVTSPTALGVGGPARYVFELRNAGTSDLQSGSRVTVALPAGLTLQAGAGDTCTAAGTLATCAVRGPLRAGEAATFTLTLVPQPSSLGSTATVLAVAEPEGNPFTPDPRTCTGDDPPLGCAVGASVPVGHGGDLTLTMTAPTVLVAGFPVSYRLVVHNGGTGAAPARVADALPTGFSLSRVDGATCVDEPAALLCTSSRPVPPGGTTTITLTVVPGAVTRGRGVVNRASVDPTGDATPEPPAGCTPGPTCAVSERVVVLAPAPPTTSSSGSSAPVSSTVAPSSAPTTTTSPDLAATGAPADSWWPVAALLLAGGAALLRLGRRRVPRRQH